MKKTIFFSWQKDVRGNRAYLEDCLADFVNEHDNYSVDSADRDPENADDITRVILEKIQRCQYFVADVSIINPQDKRAKGKRLTCNPNVLYELGYATALKKQIVLIGNRKTVEDQKELPFDIRNRRSILEDFSKDNKAKVMKHLTYALTVEGGVDRNTITELIGAARHVLMYTNQPEWTLDHQGFTSISGSLGYIKNYIEPKFPEIERKLTDHVELFALLKKLAEATKKFRSFTPVMDGGITHNKMLRSLKEINETAIEICVEVSKLPRISKHLGRDLAQATDDFYRSVSDWIRDVDTEPDYAINAFNMQSRGLDIYIDKITYAQEDDKKLKQLVDTIQKLSERDLHDFDIQRIVQELKTHLGEDFE